MSHLLSYLPLGTLWFAPQQQLPGLYMLASAGKCDHQQDERDVRAKRNHPYYACNFCGLHWRQETPKKDRRSAKAGVANSSHAKVVETKEVKQVTTVSMQLICSSCDRPWTGEAGTFGNELLGGGGGPHPRTRGVAPPPPVLVPFHPRVNTPTKY